MVDPFILRELVDAYMRTPKHWEGRILGSMTTTPHPLACYAYVLFMHTNAADPAIFSELEKMKNEILSSLSRLYDSPCDTCGLITSGGTESNILALLAALKTVNNRSRVVVAPDTVHVSIDRACDLLGCKLVKIPVDNKPVDPSILEKYIIKYNPFAVVITAGTTERGLIDPVSRIAEVVKKYNVYLHVDAAYGGLLIPFLYKHGLINTNLRFYNGVSSISVDFHKNGLAPIPSGIILFSNDEYIEKICYDAKYTLHGRYCGLLGTRPGGSIPAIWILLKHLGFKYYEEQALRLHKLALYTYKKLLEIPSLEVYKPILPIIVFKHRDISSEIILDKLLSNGYYVYRSPSLDALRIVLMPHVKKEHIDEFVNVLKHVIEVSD